MIWQMKLSKKHYGVNLQMKKMCEVICKPSHKSLCNDCPTMPGCVSSLQHGLAIQCSSVRCMCACISCGGDTPYLQTIPFDVSHYNNDGCDVRNVLHNANPDDKICKKCNTKFVWYLLVKCIVCKQDLKHYSTLSFNANEYVGVVSVDSDLPGKKWICKRCRSLLLGGDRCVTCDMEHPKHKTIKLRKKKQIWHAWQPSIDNIAWCVKWCWKHLHWMWLWSMHSICVHMLAFRIYFISSTCILH